MSQPKNNKNKNENYELYNFLASRGFFYNREVIEIINAILNAPVTGVRAFFLRGPAGTGKTSLASLVGEFLNAKTFFFQCTVGTSEEDFIYKYLPDESTKSGFRLVLGVLPQALKSSKRRKTVIIIDEIDKSRPQVDAFFLDFLQNARISLVLGDKKVTIEGKKENLVVFFTSNDEREFSEPFLRRIISLYLKPLPTELVYKLLLNQGFKEETAILLSQLYDDTIKAGLRKPATVQELIQLGHVIERGTNASFDALVKALVVKDDDDWYQYSSYVTSRRVLEWAKNQQKDNTSNVVDAYNIEAEVDSDGNIINEKDENEDKEITVTMPKIILRKRAFQRREIIQEAPLETNDAEGEGLVMETSVENYTAIIKALEPEPSDSPFEIAGYRVLKSNIIKQKIYELPDDLPHLEIEANNVEFAIRFRIPKLILERFRKHLIRKSSKVLYYSKKLQRFRLADKYGRSADVAIIKNGKYYYLEAIFDNHSQGDSLKNVINSCMRMEMDLIYQVVHRITEEIINELGLTETIKKIVTEAEKKFEYAGDRVRFVSDELKKLDEKYKITDRILKKLHEITDFTRIWEIISDNNFYKYRYPVIDLSSWGAGFIVKFDNNTWKVVVGYW